MAGKKKDLMDLRQLIQFKNQGLSNRKVADLLQINRNTVNQYTQIFTGFDLSYSELLCLDDKSLDELFPSQTEVHVHRYKTLSAYFEFFNNELKKPGCTLQTLWEDYSNKHPDGYQSSQFNYHFNRWRGRLKTSGKLEHKAGEKLYIDFTGKRLQVVDKQTGEIRDVEIFVGILPSSQYTYVTAVESQKKEDLITASIRCLEFFGGAPLAIVPDNLKAAVTKASKYEPEINKTFKDFAQHYGCSVAPTRAYSPKDKALVEGAVKLVYQRIFYPLNGQTFFSLAQLNRAIYNLLEKYNNQRFSQSNTTRNELFLSVEKPFLHALPDTRYETREFKRLKVQKMGYIFLSEDKHYYRVPYRFIGKQVKVQYTKNHLEIYFNYDRIATNLRNQIKGGYTTIQDHLASKHRAFTSWNLEYFEQRALKVGENTCKYVSQMIQQQAFKEIGYKRAQGVLMLTKTYGDDRVENACDRALGFSKHSYKLVASILKRGLDKAPETYVETLIPQHQNIRNNYK